MLCSSSCSWALRSSHSCCCNHETRRCSCIERREVRASIAGAPDEVERALALLRGVNVGRAGKVVFSVPMPPGAAGGMGATNGRLAERLTSAVEATTGVSARVVLLTSREIAEVIRANPLTGVSDDPSRLLVAFLAEGADPSRLEPLLIRDWGREARALGTRLAYLWCPDGVIASQLAKALERALDGAVTSRSWSTVLKIGALTSSMSSPDTQA